MVLALVVRCLVLHVALAAAALVHVDQHVLAPPSQTAFVRRFSVSQSDEPQRWNTHDILAAAQVRNTICYPVSLLF